VRAKNSIAVARSSLANSNGTHESTKSCHALVASKPDVKTGAVASTRKRENAKGNRLAQKSQPAI